MDFSPAFYRPQADLPFPLISGGVGSRSRTARCRLRRDALSRDRCDRSCRAAAPVTDTVVQTADNGRRLGSGMASIKKARSTTHKCNLPIVIGILVRRLGIQEMRR